MTPKARRVALGLVLAAQLVGPYFFGRVGAPRFYASWLDLTWIVFLVWSVVDDVPRLVRQNAAIPLLPWWLALAFGVGALIAHGALWSSLDEVSYFARLYDVALVHGGIAIALPSIVVLASHALKSPIDPSHAPLHRWVAVVAAVVFSAPPFVFVGKIGPLALVAAASWMLWLRELPALEEKQPARKWRIRLGALFVGAATILLLKVVGSMSFSHWPVGQDAPAIARILRMSCLSLAFAVLSLVSVVMSMSSADGLAWTLRRSRSVRTRLVVLGLCCAGLALAVSNVDLVDVFGEAATHLRPGGRRAITLTLLIGTVVAFSIALSRGLSRSLEQSMRAISEIRRGNLDVALDDSGRDELAAVARSFNQLVSVLREAEFLEQINTDLRSRSTQLSQTLDALRTAQADLVRSERMASVATLVKGIAHELNNPINYIAGNMAPLQRYGEFLTRIATELSDGRSRTPEEIRALTRLAERKDLAFVSEDLARLTTDIGEGARRAQLIITDLQSLTSAAQRGIEWVDLHRVVRQTISLLQPRVPPGVALTAKLEPVSALPARAGHLEQVLVNLTDNALRAVGERGAVQIFVGAIDGRAVVRVCDDGPGMTEEVKRQAFEPFFTTRPAGDGSGLGLAIVASIVRAHQGKVTLTSEPGKGTEVELHLPLEADAIIAAELSPPSKDEARESSLHGNEM